MEDGIVLRDYRASDLDAIFLLDEVCFTAEFRFDRESMRAFAERRKAITLIAEDNGGEVIGFAIVQIERMGGGWRGYVVTLDMAVAWRRKELAWRLMQEAERRVVAAGAQWMELHVFTGNEGAIRFYERLGYERLGEVRRFYGKAGLDAFVYRKRLDHL
jgi:ribosomal-protein-alanine N-acetyltransferase